jgi:hypothetical protein
MGRKKGGEMKRFVVILVAVALLGVAPQAWSINWPGLENDFEVFVESLGREMVPHLQQASVLGDGMYDAQKGNMGNFYLAVTTGAVLSNGFKDNVETGEYDILDVPGLMEDAFGDEASWIYDTLFPYPVVRVAAGFVVQDMQFGVLLAGLPAQVVDSASDGEVASSALNLGLRARRYMLPERGALPAIALGLGYTFSTIGVSYQMDDFSQDFGGSELGISGDLSLSSTVNTVGIDLTASKTLAFFVPYVRVSPYVQRSRFAGVAENFEANLGTGETYSDNPNTEDPEGEVISYDMALMLSTGFDIKIWSGGIFVHGNYSTGTNAFGADVGFRIAF